MGDREANERFNANEDFDVYVNIGIKVVWRKLPDGRAEIMDRRVFEDTVAARAARFQQDPELMEKFGELLAEGGLLP